MHDPVPLVSRNRQHDEELQQERKIRIAWEAASAEQTTKYLSLRRILKFAGWVMIGLGDRDSNCLSFSESPVGSLEATRGKSVLGTSPRDRHTLRITQ
jgi:hypothetical protein